MNAGVVNEVVDILGQKVPVERFVEADVGMEFPKMELTEKLFADPVGMKKETGEVWPEEFIFPPEAFRRQDESDDATFIRCPASATTLTGAVRALTNYYKENIKPGSAVLDICSSWVSHYPTDFPDTMSRISGTGMNALELEQNAQLNDLS